MLSRKRLLCLMVVLLFLSSCAGTSYMRTTETQLKPTKDKALVRFMRLSAFIGSALADNILDGEKVIGNLVLRSQFDYHADPGKHLFVRARAQYKSFLEADLEEGKTYYVIAGTSNLIPVNRESKLWNKVLKYEKTLKILEPDMTAIQKWEEVNRHKIKKVISGYETVWKDKKQWPKLNPEDGR